MADQLPLRIGLRDGATFANFHPGPNAEALFALERRLEPFLFLWSGPGGGRSHLLQAACHAAADEGAAYLPLAELAPMGPEMLEGLESMALIAVDDVQAVAGDTAWEEGLFHLYNRVRDAGGRLIAAADAPPPALGLSLADLASRLAWGPVFQLRALDDEDKAAALQMRAGMRGMQLPDNVAAYLLKHAPRDLPALFELLERLDHASLAQQRKLTIPFVKELI